MSGSSATETPENTKASARIASGWWKSAARQGRERAADDGAQHPLQRALRGRPGVGLQDDDGGEGDPVAAAQPEQATRAPRQPPSPVRRAARTGAPPSRGPAWREAAPAGRDAAPDLRPRAGARARPRGCPGSTRRQSPRRPPRTAPRDRAARPPPAGPPPRRQSPRAGLRGRVHGGERRPHRVAAPRHRDRDGLVLRLGRRRDGPGGRAGRRRRCRKRVARGLQMRRARGMVSTTSLNPNSAPKSWSDTSPSTTRRSPRPLSPGRPRRTVASAAWASSSAARTRSGPVPAARAPTAPPRPRTPRPRDRLPPPRDAPADRDEAAR